ncbi:MAG: UDP-N-acetylglucosamine 2-epimerase (non-hydrolyzing) [candidate division WOR-3 bacterium]|nr:MAG: UDP-N-acetylglucosamine 2-epimerase (non-hydrolyzing) [candidate division WOR-3 bacterium]
MYRVIFAAGARPNFMKVAPVLLEIRRYRSIKSYLVHTGQHYDKNLSKIFFNDLNLPVPHFSLGIGSGTHGTQGARVMMEFEKIVQRHDPHAVVVVGDVNSTLGCALAAVKTRCMNARYRPLIAHIEAGLRSHDWRMPEEYNRRLTDAVSDMLFTTEPTARKNLMREGINPQNIYFVGNVMIDSLKRSLKRAQESRVLSRLKLQEKSYAILTLHRPTNVDERQRLRNLLAVLKKITRILPIVFPVHPRTRKMLVEHNPEHKFLTTVPPQGYLDFLKLMMHARFVLTDSGGIQEETTVLRIPCLTLRENTERPITVTKGTNILVGADRERIMDAVGRIMEGKVKKGTIPKFWDGRAAQRICKALHNRLVSSW